MQEESVLTLIGELRALKIVTIIPQVSAFDEYLLNYNITNELLQSTILTANIQGTQI